MTKRIIESFASLLLLVLLSPLLLIVALAIKLDSRGRVIFKQDRVGYAGKTFTLYKFRTMYSSADPLGVSPVDYRDRRVTRTGAVLRKFAVDEWPQFYNILKGDMSFVGPRPQLAGELAGLRELYPALCRKRLTVRPGLTCTWAISSNKVKNKPTLEMLQEDCRYVERASFREDARIFFKTFLYLLK
jgi:lipopolysaccharide/colanic/teichoic acid biosynthesis glycosyltransferase